MIRLFAILCAVSLLLFLGASALWVRSYRVGDRILWQRANGTFWTRAGKGHLLLAFDLLDWSGRDPDFYGLQYSTEPPAPASEVGLRFLTMHGSPGDTLVHREWAGFSFWSRHTRSGGGTMMRLAVPFWAIIVATSVLPLAWLARRKRQQKRRLQGLCPRCGYDMRATPSRCPECGGEATNGTPASTFAARAKGG